MRAFALYIGFAYLAAAVQSTFFHGIKPDLVLVLVCFFAARQDHVRGMLYGGLAGLLLDVSAGFILGPNILSKALAAFLAGKARETFFQWNRVISTAVIALLSVVDIVVVMTSYEVFSKLSFANRPWDISATGVVLTVLASLIMFRPFNREEESFLWKEEL